MLKCWLMSTVSDDYPPSHMRLSHGTPKRTPGNLTAQAIFRFILPDRQDLNLCISEFTLEMSSRETKDWAVRKAYIRDDSIQRVRLRGAHLKA